MWFTLALLRFLALFPYQFQLKIGRLFGRLIKAAFPKKKAIVQTNLERSFPEKKPEEINEMVNNHYDSFGFSLMELGICWWWPEKKLKPMVEINGLERIEQSLKNGRGVILLTGHYTSLEIGARLLALHMPVQVMYRTQKNRLFDSFLFTKRSSYFVNTVSRKDTRSLVKGIKKQIPTWYAPDQDFSRENNVFAPFFGIATATITASARLAKAGNADVFPYFPQRKKDGSGYVLNIEPALTNFPSGDDLADATSINQSIEKNVRLCPEQYMWIHKRFKTRPEGEAPFYS